MEDAIAEICRMMVLAARSGNGRLPPLYKDLGNAARDMLGLKPQPRDEFGNRWLAYNIKHLRARAEAAGLDPDTGQRLDLRKFREALSKAAKEHQERKQHNSARVKAYNAKYA